MRTLENRRHSRRDPGGVHLNSSGQALARSVAGTLLPFDRVVTSSRPRAVETAVAMGCTVDAELEAIADLGDEIGAQIERLDPRTFADYLDLIEQSEPVAECAARQSDLWRTELERVPEGGRLLMISHGAIIELGAAAARGDEVRAWGPAVGYLEGVRLTWDGRRWSSGEVLRVPARPASRSAERRAHAGGDLRGAPGRVDRTQ